MSVSKSNQLSARKSTPTHLKERFLHPEMKRSRCTDVPDNVAPVPKRRCFGLCPLPSRAKRAREDECLPERPTKFQRVEKLNPLAPQVVHVNSCVPMSMVGFSHAATGSSLCTVPIATLGLVSVLSSSQLFGSCGQAGSGVNDSSDVDEDNLESGESEDDDDFVLGNRQLSGSGNSSDSDDEDEPFLGNSQLFESGESSDSEEENEDDDSSVYIACESGSDSDSGYCSGDDDDESSVYFTADSDPNLGTDDEDELSVYYTCESDDSS